MFFLQFIAVTWLALMYAFAPAHAEKRVALVIGNDRYSNPPGQDYEIHSIRARELTITP